MTPQPAREQSAAEHESSFLAQLARRARETPEAPAILSPGRDPLTFAELEARIESVASDLRALGVERGAIVAVAMSEGPDLLTALLGTMRVTAAAPLDASLTDTELQTRLVLTSARYVVTCADSRAARAARVLGMSVVEARADSHRGQAFSAEQPTTGDLSEMNWRRVSLDTALILQTSATTAASKLVPLTHRNISAICNSMRRGLALRPADVYLSVMPLHHIIGFACTVGQLLEGGRVVSTGGFEALHFASLLAKYQPTWYAGGPALHRTVLQLTKEDPKKFARNSLRFVRCGTGAASPALLDELGQALNVTVVNGYGLTEGGPVTNTVPHLPRKPGSVGRSIGPQIGIMDFSGNLLPPNTEGEVAVRGEAVMPGYLDDPAANREALRGEWLHTGDLGSLDEEGDLVITGRIKEIINRGGESIAPIEIDHALIDHPAVAQAATFAVLHPTLGEDVAAAIVLRAGATATSAEIRHFLADGRLSRARIPSRIVITDSIPTSATGKPLRKVLSERFGAYYAESHAPGYSSALTPAGQRIAEIWASLLGVGVDRSDDNFFALGGDSLSAARMIAAVDENFDLHGKLWERVEFFDSPTVGALADIVALCGSGQGAAIKEAGERRIDDLSAVFLKSRGAGAPIFFFPGERMEPWYLRHLAGHLGEDQPFVVLRHQLARADQFDAFAVRAASLIQNIRSSGPLVLAGHCYGGILAYETAQRLIAAGHSEISVILMDVPAPGYPKIRLLRYLRHTPSAIRTLLRGNANDFVAAVAGHIRFLRTLWLTPSEIRGSSVQALPTLAAQRATSRVALPPAGIVLRTYRPKPFQGSVACLNARDAEVSDRLLEDPRLGWRNLCRGLFLARQVAGGHDSMFEAHNAAELACHLQSVLRAFLRSG